MPACQLYWGRAHQRNNGLCQHFCLGESCAPSALALMSDNSVHPHMFLLIFKLLPQCWSSWGVSLCRSVCRPLRGTAWDSRSLCLFQPQSLLIFIVRIYGDFSCWHWNPGLGVLVWGWDLHFSEVTSAAEKSLQFSSVTCGCGTTCFVSQPLLPVLMRFLL